MKAHNNQTMSYYSHSPDESCEHCYTHHEDGQCEESRRWFAEQRQAAAEQYAKQCWAAVEGDDSWMDDPATHKPTGPYKTAPLAKKDRGAA